MMNVVVVSDLHLGSEYCLSSELLLLLSSIPAGAALVLNGDTIDRWSRGLPDEHEQVLDLLRSESFKRKVVWVRGNHDETFRMDDPGRIEFTSSFSIDQKLIVMHGDDFHNKRPYHDIFIRLFRFMHNMRIRLGAESVHVAYYAKKFTVLYDVLLEHVRMNAVEHAKENGFPAIVCGHTHYVEDTTVDGVRYINTGSWTEESGQYLLVDNEHMELVGFSAKKRDSEGPEAGQHH